MSNICIFCASGKAHSSVLESAVVTLVTACARGGHTIVNGGTGVGMMQLVGQTALNAGGKVLAIYPETFNWHETQTHESLSHVRVKTLHERLEKMTDSSEIFIALPGGIGTLHEIFQVWADGSLMVHKKPLHILNFEGYYNPLIQMIENAVQTGYISPQRAALVTYHTTVESLISALPTT